MPISSTRPTITIPEQSLFDAIFADLTPEESQLTAVIDGLNGQATTYGELKLRAEAFAGALAARGVKPGEIVALHCPNSPAFIIAYFGILRCGATVTTIGSLANAADITKQLANSDTVLVFTTDLLGDAGFTGAAEAGVPTDNIINLTDPEHGLLAMLQEGHTPPEVHINPKTDVAVLPYSSGTTGVPKGVMLSHYNLVANLHQMRPSFADNGMGPGSVAMAVLPFFHIYGMNCLVGGVLFTRGTLVTLPKFDLELFLRVHEQFSIDFSFIAPPIAVALAKHPMVDNFNLNSLKGVQSGAAALDKQLAMAVEERLGVQMLQGYGMTETGPVTHNSIKGVTPLDSVGPPLVNTEFKVVDLTDDALPEIDPPTEPGERSAPGEMWVRGPQVMLGYYKNDEATAATITEDGWLRTGDIVVLDHLANPYVVDRAKELIKYKGYQVAPAELEALILTREDISDVAVVGYFREEDGEEIPRAFVVPQVSADGSPVHIDPEELMAWIADRVTPYKKVRIVEMIDAIPKSATGKILRKDLRLLPLGS